MILFVGNNIGILFLFTEVVKEIWKRTVVMTSKITKEIVMKSKIRGE